TQGFALAGGPLRPEPDGARGSCVARWTGCRDGCGGSRRAAQRTHLERVAVVPLGLTRSAISLELDDGQGMRSGLGCPAVDALQAWIARRDLICRIGKQELRQRA